jgi:hypothetical protein
MRAYQRARPAIKTVEAARRWEHIYVAGAATSIALLGLWCYLAFARTSDPFTQLVSFSMTIAYTTGIFGRNFGSARFVVVQIFCAWAPITAALLIYGNIFHWIFAGLLVPAFLALKFIADRLRSTLLDAVVSSRDMSLLAKRTSGSRASIARCPMRRFGCAGCAPDTSRPMSCLQRCELSTRRFTGAFFSTVWCARRGLIRCSPSRSA